MSKIFGRSANQTKPTKQRGDTLVEVTIAMAVLGLVMASTMAVINRSLLGVTNAIERTSARGMVNTQIELIRYVFDTQNGSNRDVARTLVGYAVNAKSDATDAQKVTQNACQANTTKAKAFYLQTGNSTSPVTASRYPKVDPGAERTMVANDVYATPTAGNGVWIEGVRHAGANNMPGYIDFYVRACWTPNGANEIGQGRIESTVRVYYQEDD